MRDPSNPLFSVIGYERPSNPYAVCKPVLPKSDHSMHRLGYYSIAVSPFLHTPSWHSGESGTGRL
jgi:hypothetical protein